MNREHAARLRASSDLQARIASYELAARMQSAAKEALDISKETEATHKMYGLDEDGDPGLRHAVPDRAAADRARSPLHPDLHVDAAVGPPRRHPQVAPGRLQEDRQAECALVTDLKQRACSTPPSSTGGRDGATRR